jgi:carboxylesterase
MTHDLASPADPDDRSILLRGNGIGILLIHGLGGTPIEMKATARGLNKAGYTVLCCQLAGHCGTEADLLATGWKDWYASVETALARLEAMCGTVFVGGLSMGAMLALLATAQRPRKIAGCLCFAPTLWYDGFSISWTRIFLRPLISTPMGQRYRFVEHEPFGVKDQRIRAAIVKALHSGDSAEAGLLGTPSQSLQQFWLMIDVIRKQLGAVTAPVFIAHAREDDIASLRNAIYLQKKLGGLVDMLVLDDSYHLVTLDRQRDIVVDRAISFVQFAAERLSRMKARQDAA